MDYAYSAGESYVSYGCTADDAIDGSVPCSVTGTVNTSVIDEYTLTFTASDSEGNTTVIEKNVVVMHDATLLDVDMSTYYDSAEGLYGTALLLELRTIINSGFSGVSYGDSRYILDDSNEDPNNINNLLLIYLETSVSEVWDDGATWNREHIFPQSLLGLSVDNGSINAGSDLHNLAPADPGENSSRSNKYFTNTTTPSTYAPPAASKGDVARALFYMITMYSEYTLVDGVPSVGEMGDFSTLVSWHFADAASAFEVDRNDTIQVSQGNRNPFVDYPHLIELIYYTHPNVPSS